MLIDKDVEAKLVGDITTSRISIEDGAYFKGNIDIVRAEVAKPQPAPKPQPVASATAPAAGTHNIAAAAGGGDLKR